MRILAMVPTVTMTMQTVAAAVSTVKVAILTITSSMLSVPSFPSTVVMTPQMKNCFFKVAITAFRLHQRFTLHLPASLP